KSFASPEISMTREGLGTPLWTAPEQGREGYVAAPSSDVWALGLIMFFLLTGKHYWLKAENDAPLAELLTELARSPIIDPSVRAKELGAPGRIPAGFDAWFTRAVDRDAAKRFRDASHAFARLAPVLAKSTRRVSFRVSPILVLAVLIASCVGAGYTI